MLDLTDFAVQERPEGNLMVAISRPWYNCSYTMAAKPIKSLELHYTMMQFLIIPLNQWLAPANHASSNSAQIILKADLCNLIQFDVFGCGLKIKVAELNLNF